MKDKKKKPATTAIKLPIRSVSVSYANSYEPYFLRGDLKIERQDNRAKITDHNNEEISRQKALHQKTRLLTLNLAYMLLK